MELAEICSRYRTFISEYYEISAVAAVPADDARSGAAFLWVIDGKTPRWLRPVLIVGKVPLFYYLLHIPLIHLLAVAVSYARYGQVRWVLEAPFFFHQPPGWGYSVPIIYLVWLCVVLALYPLCWWFAGLKQRSSDGWLSYL